MKNFLKYLFPLLIFLITFAAYVYTAAPSVTFGDSGELITAAYGLGIPHPPGFPLWVILTKLFITITLFFGNIAHRANISSGFYTSLSLIVLYFIIKEILEAKKNFWLNFVSALVPIFLGFTYSIWLQSIVAEVYSLNLLLCLSSFYILLKWHISKTKNELESNNLLYVFALAFGFSLTNHYFPIIFALPYAIFIIINYPQIFKNIPKLAAMFVIFCLPLLLYLFLPIRSSMDPSLDWGDTQKMENFLRHLRREQYHGDDVNVGIYLPTNRAFFQSFFEKLKLGINAFTYILFKELSVFGFLIIPGAILLFLKKRKIFLLLFLLTFFSSFVFPYFQESPLYKLGDSFPNYSPGILIYGIFMAVTLSLLPWLIVKLTQKIGFQNFRQTGIIATTILLLIPIFFLILNFKNCNWRNNFTARDHAENLIKHAPKKSIIVSSSDAWLFPLLYILKVENQRPDINFYDRRGVLIPYNYQIPREMFRKTQKEFDDYIQELDEELIKNKEGRPVFFATTVTCTGGYQTQGLLGEAEVIRKLEEDPNFRKVDENGESLDFFSAYGNILRLQPEDIVNDTDTRFVVSWYHANYSFQLFRQNRKEEVMKEIELAERIAGSNTQALNQVAFCLNVFGEKERANNLYFKLPVLRPDKALFHYNAGVIYEEQNNLKKAEEEFLMALTLNDHKINLKIQKKLIYFYLQQFRWQEGQKIIEDVLDQNPSFNDPLIYLWQGIALNNLGQIDEAITSLEKARTLGLHTSQVYEFLGLTYLRKGDKEEARKNFEAALKLGPENKMVRQTLEDLEK